MFFLYLKNRQPLYFPGRCSENELLYPGDQKDDWVCDCVPGHLFHPDTDKCYGMYTRGPCPNRQYLILPEGKSIPECENNPCTGLNRVPFRGVCHTLNKAGPCRYPELSYVVGVNVTNLKLDCVKQSSNLPTINFEDRFDNAEQNGAESYPLPPIIPLCADGSKRAINHTCEPSSQVFLIETVVNSGTGSERHHK